MKKYELKDILLVRIIHYWRRLRDSLRKQRLLSRLSRKQPFHRLFGRLAFVVYGIVCKPTSNPFESLNKQKRETQTTSVRISLLWRRLRDSNPRGFCPNGFQDRLVMTASISLRLFVFFLRCFASLQCLCFRIFCGEKIVIVCCRATFTFARLSNYILFFRKNQLFFSEKYCFPNFSVFRLFLSLVCVRI